MRGVLAYLRVNLWAGARTPPTRAWVAWLSLTVIYALLAYPIGRVAGLLEPAPLAGAARLYLPLTLFVFPALLEEAFFRGVLIPNATRERGWRTVAGVTLLSTTAFVLWHPLNALTINPGARELFLDPVFLLLVALLGVACSLGYIVSRSLWVPVLIHWATVLVWVLWLGGRNLLLAV